VNWTLLRASLFLETAEGGPFLNAVEMTSEAIAGECPGRSGVFRSNRGVKPSKRVTGRGVHERRDDTHEAPRHVGVRPENPVGETRAESGARSARSGASRASPVASRRANVSSETAKASGGDIDGSAGSIHAGAPGIGVGRFAGPGVHFARPDAAGVTLGEFSGSDPTQRAVRGSRVTIHCGAAALDRENRAIDRANFARPGAKSASDAAGSAGSLAQSLMSGSGDAAAGSPCQANEA
jgi:hypothetical protein